MLVEKDKLKKKLKKEFDNVKRKCSICNGVITISDIENENFEYCKSSLGENFAHSNCVNKLIKHKK